MTPKAFRAAEPSRAQQPARRVWGLHVFAVAGFAIAQPLYELLGRFTPFLAAHSSAAADVLCLAAILSLVVPALLALPAQGLAVVSRRAGWYAHVATMGGIVVVLTMHLSRDRAFLEPVDILGPVALGGLAAWLYARFVIFRRAFSWLAIAASAFPVLFLLTSPVSSLLVPERTFAPASAPGPDAPPVFVLVLDELPLFSLLDEHEEIDAARFPNLAALAADGIWYRDATTVAQTTAYSVPAILSGRYPFADGLAPTARDYPTNLFTLLADGYALNVFETGTGLCPLALCAAAGRRPPLAVRLPRLMADVSALYLHLVTPRSLASRLPSIGEGWQGFWAARPARRMSPPSAREERGERRFRWYHPRDTLDEFLLSIDDCPRRTLHYLHVLLPHAPWRNLPDGHAFDAVAPPGGTGRVWTGTAWQIAQGLQRHLLQIGFVDRFLGQFRAVLEEAGLYDDSLVVLVADHGMGFRSGESTRFLEPEPGRNLTDIANVPLIVKFPGARLGTPAGVDGRNAETVDVLPTILEVLGVAATDLGLDGHSLAGPALVRPEKRIYPSRGDRSRRGSPVVFTPARLAERRESVLFKQAYLGTGSWNRVFAMGPYGALVGATAGDSVLAPEPVPFALDRATSYLDVDLDLETLPLWISGALPAAAPGRGERGASGPAARWLAVLVNGRVAAVTETYFIDEQERLATLVAPASLRRGRNVVELRALARELLQGPLPASSAPGGESTDARDDEG